MFQKVNELFLDQKLSHEKQKVEEEEKLFKVENPV